MDFNFSNFQTFLNAVQIITQKELEEAKELLKTIGKDIKNISDIFVSDNGELFDILPDGTLVRVNLYIATKTIDKDMLNSILVENLYKYHIYKCSTITNMFNAGRKEHYKRNTRDDERFFYRFTDFNGKTLKLDENQKLNICKNCLNKFLDKKFPTDNDVAKFNLKKFHKSNNSFFNFDTSSLEKGEFAIANVYVDSWNEISTQFKKNKAYTCEECGWKAKDTYSQRFIHTHHVNGDKQNNGSDNLTALCIRCHADVDGYHTRIKSNNNYKEFIKVY